MQDRGLAAYIGELIGTYFLVLVVGTVVSCWGVAGISGLCLFKGGGMRRLYDRTC